MRVAKNYEKYEQLGEPYLIRGRGYVQLSINGVPTEVRAYNDEEYEKMYPQNPQNPKEVLGFNNGYITLFTGSTKLVKDWFASIGARYHKIFGWYLPSTIDTPEITPEGIKLVQLGWDEVSNNGHLKAEVDLNEIINEKLYGITDTNFIGTPGERKIFALTVQSVSEFNSRYGKTYFHKMTDDAGNIYIWTTGTKALVEHQKYRIIATIKDHTLYHGEKQNVLVRCVVSEVYPDLN